jgi:hypothetical protein
MAEGRPTQGKPKKKEKKRRIRLPFFIWLILVLAILAAVFLFVVRPLFDIDLRGLFLRRTTESVSIAVLQETRDVLSFQTVEYVYKAVFPYDFVEPDYDWRGLLNKAATKEELTESEVAHLEFYTFCRDLGIRLLPDRFEFVVITAVVRAGYDLSGTAFESLSSAEDISDYVVYDDEARRLTLNLPEPVIVDFIIEDETSEAYPYPDIAMGPDKWKRLTEYAEERIRSRVVNEGILEQAEDRGREFLERIFLDPDTGIVDIVFLD